MTAAADAILREYWRLHPVEATHVGVHEFDAQVADLSADGLTERRAWRAAAAQKLGAIVQDDLDGRVFGAELVRQDIVDEEWQWPHRAPMLYVEQALNGLQYLLARGGSTEALSARVAAIPSLLAEGQQNLRGDLVPEEYVEIALVATAGARAFLRDLDFPTLPARQAVEDFERFLRQDLHPTGSFAIGQDGFERLLQAVHGVQLSADDVYEHGRELAASLSSYLRPDWRAEVEALKRDRPSPETLLQTYADEALRARQFVEEHHLVSIPPGEQFEVRATAPFLRATMPLGHFDRTPPFSPTDNLGVLYITPIDTQLPAARQAELLEAHCFTAVRAICLHETFPGHHVQLWHAKLRGTPVRQQFPSTLFTEGWALYCEEMMEEAGYYDSPGLQLWRLKNAMWRAVRLMVDVGLHCRGLHLDQAAQPLVELGGLEPKTARGEALRYTTSPTQPSSYVLGRNYIVELRRKAQQRTDFNLTDFHEQVLGYSSVSPALIPE